MLLTGAQTNMDTLIRSQHCTINSEQVVFQEFLTKRNNNKETNKQLCLCFKPTIQAPTLPSANRLLNRLSAIESSCWSELDPPAWFGAHFAQSDPLQKPSSTGERVLPTQGLSSRLSVDLVRVRLLAPSLRCKLHPHCFPGASRIFAINPPVKFITEWQW